MDELKRPLRVPPDFSNYAEERGVFSLLGRMLQDLLVAKPEEPLAFLEAYLAKPEDDGRTHPEAHV